jgi:hypothetical protein
VATATNIPIAFLLFAYPSIALTHLFYLFYYLVCFDVIIHSGAADEGMSIMFVCVVIQQVRVVGQ